MTLETFSIILMVLGGVGYVACAVICMMAVVSAEDSLRRTADAAEDQADALETIAREVVAYSRSRR